MKIIIEGDPIPKKRHRCRCIGKHGQAYDEQASTDMPLIRSIMHREIKNLPIFFDPNSSLIVNFTFYLPINESDSVAIRNAKLWGFIKPNKKPDFDNLIKFYCDCANGVLWRDDSMVVKSTSTKVYSDCPRTEIEIKVEKELVDDKKSADVWKLLSPDEWLKFFQESWSLGNEGFYRLKEVFGKNEEVDRDYLLSNTSMFLADFVMAYGNLFKKIQKLTKDASYVDGKDSIEGLPHISGKPSLPG